MSESERALPLDLAQELFAYDANTGAVTWRVDRATRAKAGAVAGCINEIGYRQVSFTINGRCRYVHIHRLAWFLTYGMWPAQQIDHINGDRLDNKLANLREASPAQNKRNMKKPVTNTSGFKGVSWCKANRAWHAGIKHQCKTINLGYFADVEEAAEAYRRASQKFHGEFARQENA